MSFLILNFNESPENYHFERILSEVLHTSKRSFLIIHNFKHDYSKLSKTPEINRFRFDRIGKIKDDFEMMISIDFPWKRDRSYLFYLKILNTLKHTKKILIANHLCPDPGQSSFIDDAKKYGFLDLFEKLYILDYDDKKLWKTRTQIEKRRFAIDTDYYTPLNIPKRFHIVILGSKSRDLSWIESFSNRYSIAIITLSDYEPKKNITTFKLGENIFNIKRIVNESKIMAVPIREDEKNPACGNSAAFIAMACGVVPLVRNTPYMRKYIEDGETGFLYDDMEIFKEKLMMLLEKDLKKISKQARDAAVRNLSLRDLITDILSKEVR